MPSQVHWPLKTTHAAQGALARLRKPVFVRMTRDFRKILGGADKQTLGAYLTDNCSTKRSSRGLRAAAVAGACAAANATASS